jgi:4-hydroxybenzoate polyprenyltransferase
MNIEKLKKAIKLVRVYEWVEKLQVSFAAAFILLIFMPYPWQFLWALIVLGLYMLFLGSYGYTLNSYCDREQDEKVGKHPEISYFSDRRILIILLALALFSLGIPLYFADIKIRIFGLVTFFLVTFYSAKPIRFKERGLWGISAATLTQRPLPFFLFAFLVPCDAKLAWFLFGWLCFIGVLMMVAHQIIDFDNDEKAKVYTWAVRVGKSVAKKWLKFAVVLMLVYILAPVFIFVLAKGLALGLAISLVLLVFSSAAVTYSFDALKYQTQINAD